VSAAAHDAPQNPRTSVRRMASGCWSLLTGRTINTDEVSNRSSRPTEPFRMDHAVR
jgi:hypothetical protein